MFAGPASSVPWQFRLVALAGRCGARIALGAAALLAVLCALVAAPKLRPGPAEQDGYAELVTVANGYLNIQVGSGAIDPKLCFIEIGHNGDPLEQATKDKLAAQVGAATQRTGGTPFPKAQPSPREYAYGNYVDEPLMYSAAGIRCAVLADRRYSVQALVDGSGNLAERYEYDAYGKRTVLSGAGVVLGAQSLVGNTVGYGRVHDSDMGLMYFRDRYFDPIIGRFLSRDALGYLDGSSLYQSYFVPNETDATGNKTTVILGGGQSDRYSETIPKQQEVVEQALTKLKKMTDDNFEKFNKRTVGWQFDGKKFTGHRVDYIAKIERETLTVQRADKTLTLAQVKELSQKLGAGNTEPYDFTAIAWHTDNDDGDKSVKIGGQDLTPDQAVGGLDDRKTNTHLVTCYRDPSKKIQLQVVIELSTATPVQIEKQIQGYNFVPIHGYQIAHVEGDDTTGDVKTPLQYP